MKSLLEQISLENGEFVRVQNRRFFPHQGVTYVVSRRFITQNWIKIRTFSFNYRQVKKKVSNSDLRDIQMAFWIKNFKSIVLIKYDKEFNCIKKFYLCIEYYVIGKIYFFSKQSILFFYLSLWDLALSLGE